KTNGNTDADALVGAAKGMRWDSPRGPMSIDAQTRDVVQTIYIRRVEKVGGELVNVPFDKIDSVKDPASRSGGGWYCCATGGVENTLRERSVGRDGTSNRPGGKECVRLWLRSSLLRRQWARSRRRPRRRR